MDKKLKTLFSFQEFIKDPELLSLKEETEGKYGTLLTDSELELAFGGQGDQTIIINSIVSFNTKDGIKQGKVIDINPSQYNIEGYGWINKEDICE